MPLRTNIDDQKTDLIQYSDGWVSLANGSTRQWEGSMHSTATAGSKATFWFRGYQVWVWGTIPAGNDISNEIQISIDGGSLTTRRTTSNGSAVYAEVFFQSELLSETYHTIVVTNMRSTSDGSSEFMLDRFEFEGNDEIPLFRPPGSTTSPASNTPTGDANSGSQNNSNDDGGGKSTPIGAILGAVIGVLALVIIALLYFLWWRKRNGKKEAALLIYSPDMEAPLAPVMRAVPPATAPVPFPLNTTANTGTAATIRSETPGTSDVSSSLSFSPPPLQHHSTTLSEKGRYLHQPMMGPFMSSASQLASSPSSGNLTEHSGLVSANGDAPTTHYASQSGTTLALHDRSVSLSPSSIGENPPPYANNPTR